MSVGDVISKTLLGSTCTYRVVEAHDGHVVTEVIEAPGLMPGHPLRLTTEAVAEMAPVSDPLSATSRE